MSNFRCDEVTRAELDEPGVTKLDHTAILNAALGSPRYMTLKRDANAAAPDVWATGTTFRKVICTGPMKVSGGRIVDLGKIKGTVTSTAADVSTGRSVVRIEGNGRWIEGTLGIGTNNDFLATGVFTANNGIGVKADFAISGSPFMPSGTGPAAPDEDADMPKFLRIWDYTNKANPIIVGTKPIATRDLDMVLDHPALAAEIGDIRVTRMADNDGIVFGTGGDCFRFAATVYSAHGGLNEDVPGKTVHQCVVGAKPHGRWASFPFKKDFNITNDTLSPQAFKAELLRADMSSLHIFEMYSTRINDQPGTGRAINSAEQTLDVTDTTPCQPWWTCQMALPYTSARLKPNSKMNHYFPAVDAESRDPTNVVAFDSSPDQWPILTGNFLANALHTWRLAPKWSRPRNAGPDTNIMDTYFLQPAREEWLTQRVGYGFEPGSTGQHTWFMSPGGSRHDRAAIPHVVAMWLSDPTGNRIHGNVPLKDMKWHWDMCYFNEGCFYHTNLERGEMIDKKKINNGDTCYNGTYYSGGNENFRPDLENNAIQLLAAQNQEHPPYIQDKNGRQFVNQYQRDDQHNISSAAQAVYLSNSPMHIIAARATYNSAVTCDFGFTYGSFGADTFLTRQHAWYQKALLEQWMVTTNDPRTISRSEVETSWVRHLHAVYDAVVPYMEANNDFGAKMLNNLGAHCYEAVEGAVIRQSTSTDNKAFYMGQVLLLMKQSGAWDAMRAKSAKCARILDLMVTCLAKQSVDCFVDSKGAIDITSNNSRYIAPDAPNRIAQNWFEFCPPQGQEDWLTYPDGSKRGGNGYPENYNTQHFRAQYVLILQRFFPEFNYPRLQQAVDIVNHIYTTVEVERKAGTRSQWHYRFAMMGFHNAPDYVGAPV